MMITPDKLELKFPITRATSMEPFTLPDGTRHLGFHYFLYKDETYHFLWVENTTDPVALQEQIALGNIYVLDF
jgi:hypothetical protein